MRILVLGPVRQSLVAPRLAGEIARGPDVASTDRPVGLSCIGLLAESVAMQHVGHLRRPRSAATLLIVLLAATTTVPGLPAAHAHAPGSSIAGAGARPPARWRPPVDPVLVTRDFDPPAQPWQPGHRGMDLRAWPGSPVRASGPGRITFAAPLAGRGVVVVDHGWVRTTYEPVAAQVRVGQPVAPGTVLGRVAPGTGHCGTGECLHLGLRQGRDYLDPDLLWRGRAVLIPW